MTLQVGSVTLPLNMYLPEAVTEPTNRNFTISINVTESHFGDVELIFLCNDHQLNVSHESVTKLQQNDSNKVSVPKTPTCNITSDKDTETLTLYEEVTLTVDIAANYDIRGSYCSVDSNFTLQTGDVTQLLNVAGTEADHDLSPITFNVTKTHLGGVRLILNCQHKHSNLTCHGVTELNNKTKTAAVPGNAGLYTVSTPIIAASAVGAIVCFINAVIIIMFLVKRKQVTRIKAQTSVKPPSYINVGAPGSSAYATVELNDAPTGSKNITVIDAEGYACAGDFKAENRSSSLTKDESNELSLATTSTDNPKNDLGVIVHHIILEDNTSHVNGLYASIHKTKDMKVHNDDTAI
ncbi:uncharacterized protein [Haliotis cracherodii]|uniref:uncharacterized protein n=1 Tax=Haliotis cracherodii TaxID=6455 RepID=UPI0039E99CF5